MMTVYTNVNLSLEYFANYVLLERMLSLFITIQKSSFENSKNNWFV